MNFAIKIFVNGKNYKLKIKKYITIHQLVIFLYKKNKGIVLEYNKKIITPNLWKDIYIKPEDKIEILTIVGGG